MSATATQAVARIRGNVQPANLPPVDNRLMRADRMVLMASCVFWFPSSRF